MQIKKCQRRMGGEGVYDYVIACSSLKRKISEMKVVKDFESRPHKAVTFVVERGKERQEWREQRRGYQEDAQKRKVGKEVINGILKMDVDESVENEGKRTGGQDLLRRWDCSQIENEETEESWQEGDQMTEHWEE